MNKNRNITKEKLTKEGIGDESTKTSTNQRTGKGKRKNYHGKNRTGSRATAPSCGMNDPAWYSHRPELFNTAGNLNFTYPAGYRVNLYNPLLDQLPNKGNFTIPGALGISIAPSYGNTKDASGALNIASFKEYAFLRSKNSGSRNYDAPDLSLYELSVTECVSYINWLQRTYRMVRTYTFENEYIPRGILRLENIDYDDIAGNLASFEYNLNLRIDKARQFLIPSRLDLTKRRAFMFQDIFIEGTSLKDQLYFFTPDGFYYFMLDDDGAGELMYRSRSDLDAGVWTAAQLFEHLDEMISAISSQEDFLIMAGDIYKAYGDGGILTWNNFSGDGFVALSPIFNIEVLEQIANGTSFGIRNTSFGAGVTGRYEGNIHQSADKNYLITEGQVHITCLETTGNAALFKRNADYLAMQTLLENRILTTSTDKTDQTLVFENSRLMAIPAKYESDDYGTWPRNAYFKNIICGSDLITSFSIIRFNVNSDLTRSWVIYHYGYAENIAVGFGNNASDASGNAGLTDDIAADLKAMNALSFFKFHPQVHYLMTRGGTSLPAVQAADGLFQTNVDNYTLITKDVLTRLHETALMSMLDI